MNREAAETFLRVLAETVPAGPPTLAGWAAWGGPDSGRARLTVVGQALTAVGALERETAEEILADFDLALSVRQFSGEAGLVAFPTAGTLPAAATARLAAHLRRFGWTAPTGGPTRPWAAGSAGPAPVPPEPPGPGGADRFFPVGLTVPFQDEGSRAELYLISFARTGPAARLLALWGKPALSPRQLGLRHPEFLPVSLFTVTDDRGGRYELDLSSGDGPEWISELDLRPAPPEDIRWLQVAGPAGPAVRVELTPASGPPGGEPEVCKADRSPGEQLLIMIADRLLTVLPQFPHAWRRGTPAASPGMLQAMAAGLGDIVGGLEAADVLSPDSPVPARLAALCASLGITDHRIRVPAAPDLPEPWLSLLAHYQRRKPAPAPAYDGYAAATAALPELDGITLTLLGLHTTEERTVLHLLARGVTADGHPGPHDLDMEFPLSVWLRDSAGRWHAAHLAGRHLASHEHALGLQLLPPLPRSAVWVEVLVSGRSAEVRTRVPLRWGRPP